jgi:peptidyl-prolyl cis-trans isomerase D
VRREAFSEALVQDGTASDPIELGPNHSVVIRVSAHTPEQAQPLAQVREQVIAAIRADRARKAAQKQAEALLARLRAGESLEQVVAGRGLAPVAMTGVRRGVPSPDPQTNGAIFAAAVPAAGKTTPGSAPQADGSVVLFAVGKVTPGDPAEATPLERLGLQQQIAQMGGDVEARAHVAALRRQWQIQVAEDRL